MNDSIHHIAELIPAVVQRLTGRSLPEGSMHTEPSERTATRPAEPHGRRRHAPSSPHRPSPSGADAC